VSSILTGGIAGLFLLAFLSPRANRGGAWVGIITCVVFTGWATLTSGKEKLLDLGAFNFPWPGIMIGVIGHVLLLVTGFLGSYLFPPPPPESRRMTLWGWLEQRNAARAGAPAASGVPEAPLK
jgi:SSS family solute:Na+ symporter